MMFCWLFFACAAAAAPDLAPQYRATTWRSVNGLPHSSVSALFQDRDGYLWVGTYLGAARFDGVRFQSLAELSGDTGSVDLIESITQTADGAIWFAGIYRGLMRLDSRGQLTRFDQATELPSSSVVLVRPHPEGGLWLGTNLGLYHATIESGRMQLGPRELDQTVWDLAEDHNGIIHAATENGPWRRTPSGWQIASLDPQIAKAHIWSITFDAGGHGFAGLRGGLAELGPDGFRFSPRTATLPSPVVRAVLPDRGGLLWVATSGRGIRGLWATSGIEIARQDGLASDVVWELLRDREGALWAGTASGLSRIGRAQVHAFGQREGLPQGMAWAIAPRVAGGWWLGFNEGGLIAFDGHARVAEAKPEKLPQAASAILSVLDQGDVQWVGSVVGLFKRGADGHVVEIAAFRGQRVQSLYALDAGSLLVGTSAGLWRLRGDQAEPIELPGVAKAQIARIRGDGPGRWLIAAAMAGLYQYDGEHAQRLAQLDDGRLRDALRTPDGRIWLAGIGLHVLDHGQLRPIEAVNRVLPVQFHALELDALGRLWASSNVGVLRVALSELDRYLSDPRKPPEYLLIGENEGMRSSECNGGTQNPLAIDAEGAVWVATTEGIVRIPADAEPKHLPLPEPRLERVVVDGAALAPESPLQLAAGSRQIVIDYTALRLTDADTLRFRYRLVPSLPDWIEVGSRRSIAFDALAPGRYRVDVAVGTATEPWGEAVALDFEVAPHWWQRNESRILGALALLALAAALPLLRVRSLKLHERLLKAQVGERTQELEQANVALEHAASRDFLTGLPNRRVFAQTLDDAITSGEPVALAMLDIDHFKTYNDALGHIAGDHCLSEFAALLAKHANVPGVLAARVGGEEFALLFMAQAVPQAGHVIDAIQQALRRLQLRHPASMVDAHVTFSAGLARLRADDVRAEDLIRRADAALYRAKAEGRNRCVRGD